MYIFLMLWCERLRWKKFEKFKILAVGVGWLRLVTQSSKVDLNSIALFAANAPPVKIERKLSSDSDCLVLILTILVFF
jgi:hypothetical protein